MRIIDKNVDFYDYLQNVYGDDSLVFDRTDSFVLTKEIICERLPIQRNRSRFARNSNPHGRNFLLLQIGNAFWLFYVKTTRFGEFDEPVDCEIELATKWKNYDKPRKLCVLDAITFPYRIDEKISGKRGFWKDGYDMERIVENSELLKSAVNGNEYRIHGGMNYHVVRLGNGETTEKKIPLLKASGLAGLLEPLETFLAFEEYFSLEKTSSERTEAIGATNEDKIESHGFDVKTSFRGKR